jgi:gas vesicle protein
MENNHRRGSVTLAFVLGAVAGGVAALLYAPQTGAQMRGRLKRGAHDLQEKGSQLAHDMEDRASSVTGAAKGAAKAARTAYRDEIEKRVATPAMEPKLYGEQETVGGKPRTGVMS